jgi:hypothetical protein
MKTKRSRKETVSVSLRVPRKVLRVFEMASLISGFQMHEIIEVMLALEVAKSAAAKETAKRGA